MSFENIFFLLKDFDLGQKKVVKLFQRFLLVKRKCLKMLIKLYFIVMYFAYLQINVPIMFGDLFRMTVLFNRRIDLNQIFPLFLDPETRQFESYTFSCPVASCELDSGKKQRLILSTCCTLPFLSYIFRLIGCQNLMVDIPRRLPRPEISSMIAIGGDNVSGLSQKSRSTRGLGPRSSRFVL